MIGAAIASFGTEKRCRISRLFVTCHILFMTQNWMVHLPSGKQT